MKKMVLAAFVLMTGAQVKAATITEASQLLRFKQAVVAQVGEKICSISANQYRLEISDIVNRASVMELTEGDQTLLSFTTAVNLTVGTLAQTVVVTSEDHKEIQSIKINIFKKDLINKGDLKNPNMVEGLVQTATCE